MLSSCRHTVCRPMQAIFRAGTALMAKPRWLCLVLGLQQLQDLVISTPMRLDTLVFTSLFAKRLLTLQSLSEPCPPAGSRRTGSSGGGNRPSDPPGAGCLRSVSLHQDCAVPIHVLVHTSHVLGLPGDPSHTATSCLLHPAT